MSMPPTFNASCTPVLAPLAAASITLASGRSVVMRSESLVTGVPSSGLMIFESSRPAGAFITLAASRCPATFGKTFWSIST